MQVLPIFIALVGRPVILIGEGDMAEAKRRLILRAGGVPVDEAADARLAIVALEDPSPAVARLRLRGILVNAVDRPDLSDFIMPAMIERGPVTIAISTAGRSAGLAKALRQRIEALLPSGLGKLADALFAARAAIRARWPDPAARRRALDDALAEGGALDPLGSEHDVTGWVRAADDPSGSAFVPLMLASGDPEELTLRVARLLAQADVIYHRPEIPAAILDRARADAVRVVCTRPPVALPGGLVLDLEIGG